MRISMTILLLNALLIALLSCSKNKEPAQKASSVQKDATSKDTGEDANDDTTRAERYFAKANEFAKADKYDSAIVYFKAAGELYKYDGDWHKYIKSYLEASGQLGAKGSIEEKIQLLNQILATGLKNLGEVDLEISKIYNELAISYFFKAQYQKSLELFEKSLHIVENLPGDNDLALVRSYNNIGLLYWHLGEYEKMLAFYNKGLTVLNASTGEKRRHAGSLSANLGLFYSGKGDYEQAETYLRAALNIFQERAGEKDNGVATMYRDLGVVYLRKEDYENALLYFDKALKIFRELPDETSHALGLTYNNIGVVYERMREFDKALFYYQKTLEIFEHTRGHEHPDYAGVLSNIGMIQRKLDNHEQALSYLFEALAIRTKIFGPTHHEVAINRSNIGVVYRDAKKYSKALEFYAEALRDLRGTFGQRQLEVADNCLKIADVYFEMGDFEQALFHYQQALISNSPSFANTDSYALPASNDCFSNSTFLESLKQKALALAKRHLKQPIGITDAEAALQTFLRASDFVDHVRQNYTAEGSKLFLGQSANQFYDVALAATLKLYQQTKDSRYQKAAVHFSEKSKAGILLEALSEAAARRFAGLPDTLLENERQMRIDLAFYDENLTEEKSKGSDGDGAKIALWQDKVFNLKQRYDGLLQKFEKEYPDYYNLKYQTQTASVQEVQNQILGDNTALLEYFTGKDSIYIFTITKSDFDITVVAKDSLFERQIEQLRDGIVKKDYALYAKAAYVIYRTLLAPIAPKLTARNLIIVPDGPLGAVPFEVLLAREVSGEDSSHAFAQLPYLVNDHTISYAYSATLLLETLKRHRAQNKRNYLAYAPVFPTGLSADSRGADFISKNMTADSVRGSDRLFGYLSASKQEVNGVLQQFKSREGFFESWFGNKAKVYLERDAKEDNLKSTALREYRYVHFATHGLLNESNPKLSGLVMAQDTTSSEDGILYLGEIYNLDLNADLVTLSACETGLGQIAKGEGIIGLTRGFLYAGAANLLVSLWQVNDQTTADLMVDFYGNMLDGQTKAEALRQAKLKLIASHPEYAKPYYWAPFVLIGR